MDSKLKRAVLEVYRTSKNMGIKSVLVGALIAELSPEINSDYPIFRRTNDADFALYIRGWEAFRNLRRKLIERGFEQDPKVEHRLLKGAVKVDLIPYGNGIAPHGKLRWPESEFEMNVIGFEEACAAAEKKVKQGGPPVPIVTIPGFVLLKIIAFVDRQSRQDVKYRDDACDIHYWLENYASGNDDTRRFDATAKIGTEEIDYEAAGAALLGWEVRQLASKKANKFIEKFLSESSDLYAPFMDAIASRTLNEDQDLRNRKKALKLLRAFEKGYKKKDSLK